MNRTDPKQVGFLNDHVADGGFLQSEEWRAFQESNSKKTFRFQEERFFAGVIEHRLPWVGKYWYIPRGPVVSSEEMEVESDRREMVSSMIERASKEHVGWIRIEPKTLTQLALWQSDTSLIVEKSPHNMQPEEILVVPIDRPEEELLAAMKSKTRYNIRLAEKKGVRVFVSRKPEHIEAFCDLVEETAKRDGITPHPRAYYQNMFRRIPEDMMKLYVAEYEGKIIAANTVMIFGRYATYLHGASGNAHRECMAPHVLQWCQICDARKSGCDFYDFGGVNTRDMQHGFGGITRFKQGFAPTVATTIFPGSYDIVVRRGRYRMYRILQMLQGLQKRFQHRIS